MIILGWDEKKGKYTLSVPFQVNHIAQAVPDRRWSKKDKLWYLPDVRKNREYLVSVAQESWRMEDEARTRLHVDADIQKRTIDGMPAWFPFNKPPMKHQAHHMDRAIGLDFYALLFEQGLGKTFTSINLMACWRMMNQIDAVVVICPSAVMGVWQIQTPQHCPIEHSLHLLQAGKTATKRFNAFNEGDSDYPVLVVGIEALQNGSGYHKVMDFMNEHNCGIILDESSTIKNHKPNRTKRVDTLARMAPKRLILSGTSITEGIENLYPQFHFLDPDVVGYDNFYSFRNRYCVMVDIQLDPGNPDGRTFKKTIDYQNVQELVQAVSFCTGRVEKKDALDLPPKIHQHPRKITPTLGQQKAMQELDDSGYTIIDGEDILCDAAITKLLRIQQVTGGFYPVENPDVELAQPIPGSNPKIEDLVHWLGETSGQVIVWCNFRAEHAAIVNRIQKEGYEFVTFQGGMSIDEKVDTQTRFQTTPSIKVCICTYAAARGLDLFAATANYYFSLTFSAENYWQSQDRSHRIGTTESVTYEYADLVGSPDGRLRAALHRKEQVAEDFYDQLEEGQ